MKNLDPSPVDLQLGSDAGSLAGQVADGPAREATPRGPPRGGTRHANLRHPAARHRRAHPARHVARHLRPHAPGPRRHRRHPLRHRRLRERRRQEAHHAGAGHRPAHLGAVRRAGSRPWSTGDLGKSYRYDLPAWQVIKPLLPVTIELAVLSTIIAVLLGVPTGVISAVRQDTALDYALRIFSLAGLSMPSFWLGMVIILVLVAPGSAGFPPSPTSRPTQDLKIHAGAVSAAGPGRGLSLVRAHHAHHALGGARGDARGLHPHGLGQGAERAVWSSGGMRSRTPCCRSSP